jgi:2-keto-4-pentenoate hydratase/2-oxohepta-3-ene-1,7-dioic acid hydratase in catechol pathway
MRLVRYQIQNEAPQYGWALVDSDETFIGPIEGTPFGEFRRLEANLPKDSVRLLAPVQPSKIICIGRNYVAHVREHNSKVPEVPLLFLKPPSSVIGPNEPIILPPQSQQVEHEAELVAVIAKRGRWISPEEAFDYLLGYTVGNDITARDLQRRDGQWTRAKGFDTFCPIGPWIETDFDPSDALITCYVNGEMRQMASSRDMVFSIRQLIAYVSSVMTLETGDILLTGTPAGVGPLSDGDVIETTIEGIGTLRNSTMLESAH